MYNVTMLKNKIQEKMIESMKAKEAQKTSVYRMLYSQIKNVEIDKQKELLDDEVVQIIKKQIIQLKDAAAMFITGGRPELAEENNQQITILNEFLPPEASDEEIEQDIKKLLEEKKDIYEKNPKAFTGICVGALKSKADSKRIVELFNKITNQ